MDRPLGAAPRRGTTSCAAPAPRANRGLLLSGGSVRPESPWILPLLAPRAGRPDSVQRTAGHVRATRPRVLPRPVPAPRHVAVDPAVASMRACRLKTGPLLLPRRTDPPALLHARRRPPWGLLGERHFPLHSVAVPATLHLPETPWKPPLSRVARIRPGLAGISHHRG
jgi:hypothetical protein